MDLVFGSAGSSGACACATSGLKAGRLHQLLTGFTGPELSPSILPHLGPLQDCYSVWGYFPAPLDAQADSLNACTPMSAAGLKISHGVPSRGLE